MHVQKYCFSLSNMQICGVCVAVVVVRHAKNSLFLQSKYGNHSSFRSCNFRSTTAIRRSLGQRFRIQTTSFPGSLFFISLERKRKKARKKRIGRMKRTTRFIFLKTGQTSFSYSSKQATSIQCNNCSFQTCHLITLRWKEPRWVKKSKGTEKLKNPVIFLVVT